jgi:hypothetical protein
MVTPRQKFAAEEFALDHVFAFRGELPYRKVMGILVADFGNMFPFSHETLTVCSAYDTLNAELIARELELLYVSAEQLLEVHGGVWD